MADSQDELFEAAAAAVTAAAGVATDACHRVGAALESMEDAARAGDHEAHEAAAAEHFDAVRAEVAADAALTLCEAVLESMTTGEPLESVLNPS